MALRVNQSGTWRNITIQCVNQSGTWRRVVDGCINQTGTWRCYGMSAPTGSLSVSPSSYVEGGSATLTWSSAGAKCVVSTSNFSTALTSGSTTVSGGATRTFSITFGNEFGNSTAATATLTVTAPALGSSFGGGTLICAAGGVRWIVAPSSSQVTRTWYARGDAATRAQQVSGVSGWFIPGGGQLQNPGFCCRTYWGPSGTYWSNDGVAGTNAQAATVYMANGFVTTNQNFNNLKSQNHLARAFRCLTY